MNKESVIAIEFRGLIINFLVILVFYSLFLFPERSRDQVLELDMSVETQFPNYLPNLEEFIITHLDYCNNYPAGLTNLRCPSPPLYSVFASEEFFLNTVALPVIPWLRNL